jgi:Anti-sigma factor NepR
MMLVGMGRRPRVGFDLEAVRTGIGTALRLLHSGVLNEPLPEKIAELLRRLDQRLGQFDQQKDLDRTWCPPHERHLMCCG